MRETSVGSCFHANNAVVQKTCRRESQAPLITADASRQPAAKYAGARTRRSKLEERQCFPLGEGKIRPSGLVPASCSARASSIRAARRSASGYPTGVVLG